MKTIPRNTAIDRLYELRRMPYKDYLQSPEWQERRRQALLAAGGKCQVCNQGQALHVHHRTYDRRGMELPSDLTALCEKCHGKHHGKEKAPTINRLVVQRAFEQGVEVALAHVYHRRIEVGASSEIAKTLNHNLQVEIFSDLPNIITEVIHDIEIELAEPIEGTKT
jgi:cytochrome c553